MKRQVVLLAALGLTLFACWWVGQSDNETAVPPAATQAVTAGAAKQRKPLSAAMPALNAAVIASEPPRDSLPSAVQEARPLLVDEPVVNLFAGLLPPETTTADTVEAAPVNPYTYAGRLLQEGRWLVFLTDGQQQYVVREGERFAEGWRVTRLDQHRLVLQHAGERFEMMLENGGML